MNNEKTSVQPKLMDYFVQNPDEFVEKFQHARVPLTNYDILQLEKSSQYFKFDVDFNPENFSKDSKYLFILRMIRAVIIYQI